MRRRSSPPAAQLALDLKREVTALPIAQDPTALLQALADLLLGALGEKVEVPTSAASNEGGADEPEDHA
jgi:hypothetical protein